MCELCLDSREGDACKRPEHAMLRSPRRGKAFKRTKTKAPHSGPRGGGEEEAKPSRLRLAEPAHARALAVRASHFIIFILIFLQHAAASDAAHDRNEPEDDSNDEKGRNGAGEKETDEPDHQADHGDDVMPLAR